MKERVELRIKRITQSKHSPNAYVVLLEHIEGTSRVPIVIGALEAQALLLSIQPHLKQARPVTHDLFVNFIRLSGLNLEYMVIEKNINNVFFSSLNFKLDDNEKRVMDARTSDALNLCVRYGAPIYMNMDLWKECMVNFEEFSKQTAPRKQTYEQLRQEGLNELQDLLDEAVANEDFERAARLRDHINRLKEDDTES